MRDAVILTRQREDTAALAEVLRARAREVIDLPCIRTEPLADGAELATAISSLRRDDLVVLTSRAGVDAVAACRSPIPCRVAVIGPATERRARSVGLDVVFRPSRPDGATLAREVPLPRGRVVLLRSDLADAELPELLRRRGAHVVEVPAYHTVPGIDGDTETARLALSEGRATILVASPSAVSALRDGFDGTLLARATFVAIGARTGRAVSEIVGVDPVIAFSAETSALADLLAPVPEEVST